MKKQLTGDCHPNLIDWVKSAKASDELIKELCGHVTDCPKCLRKLVPAKNFKHFKGGIYKVTGFARDANSLEYLVIYRGNTGTWTRSLIDFFTPVKVDGQMVPRFKEVD